VKARKSTFATVSEAMTASLQWRLLGLWTATLLLPTAVVALPIRRLLSPLEWSPRATELAQRFDAMIMGDLIFGMRRGGGIALSGSLAAAMLLMLVLTPWLAGIVLTAAQRPTEPPSLLALARGAIGWYGRMARLLLVSLVPLGACVTGMSALLSAATKLGDHTVRESNADALRWTAIAIATLMFAVVQASLEAARAELAVDERLRSGWRAWLRGLQRLGRQPLAVLALYAVPTLASLVVAALLVRVRIAASTLPPLGFVLTQLVAGAIGWGRAGRLFALTALATPAASERPLPPVAGEV
jgi:hypothetical protein